MRVMLIMILLAGCPVNDTGLSPRAGCEQGAATQCDRMYACFTTAELAAAGYPSTQAACTAKLEDARGCSAQTLDNTCKGNAVYHPDDASDCIDEIAGLACSQLRDRTLDLEAAAPACGRVCRVE